MVKKIFLISFFLIVFLTSCQTNKKTDLDKAEKVKPYVNKINKLDLTLIDSISTFTYKGKEYDVAPLCATINYEKNDFIFINRYSKSIISFDLDEFSNNQECTSFIKKNSGKGPNEFNKPNDMIYNDKKEIYYISDLLNYTIYIYNSDFFELNRIKLPFRPYKIAYSQNSLYVTSYDIANEYSPYKIDINSKREQKGLFVRSTLGTSFERLLRNQIIISPIDNEDKHFFIVKNYPNFNIYEIKDKKIIKVFCSPSFKGKRLPKPKLVYRDNDKKIWALEAFSDIIYDSNDKLLFAITSVGWEELAKNLKIDRDILIFDNNGNTLCEYKILPYEGSENSICYDSKNKILYYLSSHYIKKFKINNIGIE